MDHTNSERKSVNKGEILADSICNRPYGETIRYQHIEEVTGERRGTSRYYGTISKAKKILEERGKMIAPIGGGDYQILYPGDYVSSYAREVRLANRRIKHGGKILRSAPVNDMTQDELQAYNRVSDFHSRLNASISGNVVEVKKLASHDHPLRHMAK